MTIQIAKGKQTSDKEIYIDVGSGFFVAAKLSTVHIESNLKHTYGGLLLSEEELCTIMQSGRAEHPRGGFVYTEDELSLVNEYWDILVRWDTESRRIC